MAGPQGLFGLAAPATAAWRTLDELATGRGRAQVQVAVLSTPPGGAHGRASGRHPRIGVADKVLGQVTCTRLDASVVVCPSKGHSCTGHPAPGFTDHGVLRTDK